MASIVWVQLFVLSNYNIFTQYLKKYSENTVKVIVFYSDFTQVCAIIKVQCC